VAGPVYSNSKRLRKIKFKAILFDLDGTLLDTLADIVCGNMPDATEISMVSLMALT